MVQLPRVMPHVMSWAVDQVIGGIAAIHAVSPSIVMRLLKIG